MVSVLRFSCLVALLSVWVLAALPASQAARDFSPAVRAASDYQLLVLEVEDCVYCYLFRRDVAPGYMASPRAKTVPIRFVDLNHASLDGFVLDRPVDAVPTVLVVKKGKEVGRVSGYVGPEPFYHAINRLLVTSP
jgi:thioredoxin-related protein